MTTVRIDRRRFLTVLGGGASMALLAACSPSVPAPGVVGDAPPWGLSYRPPARLTSVRIPADRTWTSCTRPGRWPARPRR